MFGEKIFQDGGKIAPKDAISGFLAYMEELQMLPSRSNRA